METMINGLVKCEGGRAANIIALLKDSGFIATEHNALTAAAILCDAIPIRGSATHYLPHAHIAPLGLDEANDVDPALYPCCRPSGGGWSSSITNADGELKKNWMTEYLAVKQNQYKSYVGFTTDCYDMGDPRRSQHTGGITLTLRLTPALHRSHGGSAHSFSLMPSGRLARPSAKWSDWLLLAPLRRLVHSARNSPGIALSATPML